MSLDTTYLALLNTLSPATLELLDLLDPAREEDELIIQSLLQTAMHESDLFAEDEVVETTSFHFGSLPSIGETLDDILPLAA